MIPVTYPSSLSYRTARQMVAYPITDLTGKRRWTDYIPVKFVDQTTFTVENSHNNNAYISVDMLSSNANLKEGIDYIPIYIDDAATDAWQVSATGYIPVGYSGASLSLQFAGSTFLDSRITFTRASSGTYFDNTGVLRRANRNLLTYSEQFNDAAWTKNSVTVSANSTTAPDGALTADKVIATAVNGSHNAAVAVSVTSGVAYTFSVYAKAGEYGFAGLLFAGAGFGSNTVDVFNLSTGAVSTNASGTASIVSVGNGWYRCSSTRTASTTASSTFQIRALNSAAGSDYTGDGTSGIFIWGAQLEESSTATVYSKTVASTSGAPRFDHDPVTKAPRGLLIEEQRTNLLLRSEEFDNAAWSPSGAAVSANSTVAPDGALTGDKLVEDTSTAVHQIAPTTPPSASGSTTYTTSFFAKAAERSFVGVWLRGAASGDRAQCQFNLSTGAISLAASALGAFTNASATVTSVGNGWYRCTLTGTTGAGETTVRPVIFVNQTSGAQPSTSYTGDGTSGIFIWGAQLEAGAFSTSYIQTVAAQVTRSADSASMTGTNFSSWYSAGQGTLLAEGTINTSGATAIIAAIDDGTANNRIRIGRVSGGNGFFGWAVGGVPNNINTANTITLGTNFKMAIGYQANDVATVLNAGTAATLTTQPVPVVNSLIIGSNGPVGSTSQYGNGHIRKLAFYPARLANAQLQALTR